MERIATQDQTVKVRGKIFKQHAVSSWRIHFDVLSAEHEKCVLRATFKAARHKREGTGAGEHGSEDLLQGRHFKLAITPHGRILAFEGYADFASQFPEKGRAVPEETLREALAEMLGPLPEKALRPGATWQSSRRETIPHFGVLVSTRHFMAARRSGGFELGYTIETSYQLPALDEAPVFRVVKGTLSGEDGHGEILFDPVRGRLLRHERRLSIRGTLAVETMGKQVPLEFASAETVEIRLK
jgi:hypothetical protein